MHLRAAIQGITSDLVEWRHHLHANPELAYRERKTAAFVANKLRQFGLEVHEGIGETGVVGVLRRSNGPSIGLRADMDALPITEKTGLPYSSRNSGCMHACGHDGHTTMLLGAARILAEAPPSGGNVVFIFQPAEEGEAGGKAMLDAGLFRDFPIDSVYGLHNWPGIPAGEFAVHSGPVMAAMDVFEAQVTGKASHGAMPHEGVDPVALSGQLYQAWQLLISRTIDPTDSAVISVTQIHGGQTWNVIPESVVMCGTVRTLRPKTRDLIEKQMADRAHQICRAYGGDVSFRYERRYPPTINSSSGAQLALDTVSDMTGHAVRTDAPPSMAAEDFAFMLEQKPGAYIWLGNGPTSGAKSLHSPFYDFNDDILPIGVEYWVRLAHRALGNRTL